jgi:hypothetical protein
MKCPRCGVNELKEEGGNALSREDNETIICDTCGVAEAMREYIRSVRNGSNRA